MKNKDLNVLLLILIATTAVIALAAFVVWCYNEVVRENSFVIFGYVSLVAFFLLIGITAATVFVNKPLIDKSREIKLLKLEEKKLQLRSGQLELLKELLDKNFDINDLEKDSLYMLTASGLKDRIEVIGNKIISPSNP